MSMDNPWEPKILPHIPDDDIYDEDDDDYEDDGMCADCEELWDECECEEEE